MSVRIAVIDDDPDIVELLKANLKSRGYEVVTACDGEDGLQMMRASTPDLVILDLLMPKMSGIEVLRRMREDPQLGEVPVVVLSAIGEKSGKSSEFWRAGLRTEDFLSKADFINKGEIMDPALIGRIEYVLRRNEYVSSQRKGAGKSEGTVAARDPKPPLLSATPREVVRCFVEAWNSRDFADEWTCLSGPMRGSVEKEEYIVRRQQAYADEGASAHRQRLATVVEEVVNGTGARVLIEREDIYGQRRHRRREQYTLSKSNDGWKIVNVRVLPK